MFTWKCTAEALLSAARKCPFVRDARVTHLSAGDDVPNADQPCRAEAEQLRVRMALSFERGSYTQIEIAFPAEWDGTLVAHGNGGSAGSLPTHRVIRSANGHMIGATTDLGTSRGVKSGIDNPAVARDFGDRASHATVTHAKALAEVLYGTSPVQSIYNGASTGGQQALSEAENHPDDFDAIICGAPANNRMALHAYFIWNYAHTHGADGTPLFTEAQGETIADCADALIASRTDGRPLADFLLDPATRELFLSLAAGQANLSEGQRASLRALYEGPKSNGNTIYCGLPIGTERRDPGLLSLIRSKQMPFAFPFLWAMGADFDPMHFDFDRDFPFAAEKLSCMDANSAQLRPFFARGGKLLLIAGTGDPCVPFPETLNYARRVRQALAPDFMRSMRVFVLPGLDHYHIAHRIAEQDPADFVTPDGRDVFTAMRDWLADADFPTCLRCAGADVPEAPIR